MQTTKVDMRKQILNKYKWLQQRNLDMVTHNDLDGILTAMILNHVLGWNLVGVYDLKTLQFNSDFKGNIRDVIYVDLDVTHKSFKSMGHHILGKDEGEHLNINREFGIDYSKYRNKFPISTAMFLFWLFELDFFKLSDIARLFLLHSDSAWKNYYGYEGRYTQNVIEWFHRLEMEEELKYLQHPSVLPSIEKYVLPNTFSFNNQCTYLAKNGELVFRDSNYNVQKYVDGLCEMFGFDRLVMPTNLVEKGRFKRETFDIVNRNLEKTLDEARKKYRVFSYSVKYANKVDISYV